MNSTCDTSCKRPALNAHPQWYSYGRCQHRFAVSLVFWCQHLYFVVSSGRLGPLALFFFEFSEILVLKCDFHHHHEKLLAPKRTFFGEKEKLPRISKLLLRANRRVVMRRSFSTCVVFELSLFEDQPSAGPQTCIHLGNITQPKRFNKRTRVRSFCLRL